MPGRGLQLFSISTELLQEIETIIIPDNTILASLDVSSLYTNIPTDKVIEKALEYLKKEAPPQQPLSALPSLPLHCFVATGGVVKLISVRKLRKLCR